MKTVDTLKVYLRHPKYVVTDIRFYIKKYKEDYKFWLRKKILNNFLNSESCTYTYKTRHEYKPFNNAMLFPCSIVSMVLLEHFKRIEWLGIHTISVDTQSDEAVTATIALARPGLLIGKGGKDIDAVRERLSELFGKETNIDIKEVNDVNKEKILKYPSDFYLIEY